MRYLCINRGQITVNANIAKHSTQPDTNCWDNAPMESFFHSLKVEQVHHDDYRTRDEARSAIFDYIEIFYNRQRKHSYIDYQSPVDFEKTTGCITECA